MSDGESDAVDTEAIQYDHDHSMWSHLVRAGGTTADMTTDVAAIAAIAWMAVEGVEPATLQAIGAMVVSVALGKRYMANKHRSPDGN